MAHVMSAAEADARSEFSAVPKAPKQQCNSLGFLIRIPYGALAVPNCLQREGHIPVPVRVTACGLPPPSLLKRTDAVRAPIAVGLNVTLTVQLPPVPKVLPQVLGGEREKSPAFAPRIAICHKFIVTVPLFVRVIVCAALLVFTVWLAKGRVVGDKPAAVPTAVRTTV